MPPAAILDIDGTLVDTNHHHAIAWHRAFRQRGVKLPLWQIHLRMGMGGDRLVADVAGEDVERDHGDAVRAAEKVLYTELMREITAFEGALELIGTLRERGNTVVLATSASRDEADYYLELIGAPDLADACVTGADVEQTKPSPEPIEIACERAGRSDAVLVGDSIWDCEAAREAGVPTIGMLSGGFSRESLREAGATCVFASLTELRERLDETPLAG